MRNRKHKSLGALLALLLFGVFAVCIMSVLLTGADAYKRLTERDETSYDRRTAVQYLATRVRQADAEGSVLVASFDGTEGFDTLILSEDIDGELYYTRVYCCDGYLRELFGSADAEMSPEDGEKVLEAESLSFDQEGNLLTAEITNVDGAQEKVVLCLRSGEGADL